MSVTPQAIPDPATTDWVPLGYVASALGVPQPVVDGQWLKGVGGAAVWAPIRESDTELGYATYTGLNISVTATTHATSQLICSLPPLTFDGATKIRLSCGLPRVDTPVGASGHGILIGLYEAGTSYIILFGFVVSPTDGSGFFGVPVYGEYVMTPSAGSHTYSLRSYVTTGSGAIVSTQSGLTPCFLRATRA